MMLLKSLTILLFLVGSGDCNLRDAGSDLQTEQKESAQQQRSVASRRLGQDKVKPGGGAAAGGGAAGGGGGNAAAGGGGGGDAVEEDTSNIGVCDAADRIVGATGTGGSITMSKCNIKETMACQQMSTVSDFQRERGDVSCSIGTCPGCCRIYNYLVCDKLNLFSTVPCVCSALTYSGQRAGSSESSVPAIATGTTDTSAVVTTPAVVPTVTTTSNAGDASQCTPGWHGQGLGEKPSETPAGLPDYLAPGECLTSAHCKGTIAECCLRDFCLCGAVGSHDCI